MVVKIKKIIKKDKLKDIINIPENFTDEIEIIIRPKDSEKKNIFIT